MMHARSHGTAPAPVPEELEARPCPHEPLAFVLTEGHTENHFFRDGAVAAHLLATSGTHPRLLVAFPAGNTGLGLWFEPLPAPVALHIEGGVQGVERTDGLRGVSAVLQAETARLRVARAVLGSVRTLRDCATLGTVPADLAPSLEGGASPCFHRVTVDGKHQVRLLLEPLAGTVAVVEGDTVELQAAPGATVRVRLTALADDPPLTPIPPDELLTEDAADSPRERQALAFLSYREKLLAGSWRFLTYFGRDTLLSTRLLMPVLRPAVIEAALGAVLDRLHEEGDVAHEEDIGEFAVLQRRAAGAPHDELRSPLFDYSMVDDDFLLAPVLAHYLLDTPAGRERGTAFLARRTEADLPYAEALRRNLALVLRRAAPFAAAPGVETLIALRPHTVAGQWRDSLEGLGEGRIPYDVNAVLVPAALHAAARLYESGLLGADPAMAEHARRLADAWGQAEGFFRVQLEAHEARARLAAYASEQGLQAAPALAMLTDTVEFPAVALDGHGTPLPVMHSDDGYALLFATPSPSSLEAMAQRLVQPFPAGLRTPVGVVVANPVYASEEALRGLFTRGHYHGTVVWSWQQALLAAGLRRQLARPDLPASTRTRLDEAEAALWEVIHATAPLRSSELWSFECEGGVYHLVPYGQGGGHADESNAVQLWSTVFLAVQPPSHLRAG